MLLNGSVLELRKRKEVSKSFLWNESGNQIQQRWHKIKLQMSVMYEYWFKIHK